METEGPKEKETQQMNGLEQKEESGDTKPDIHEENEEGKRETPGDGKEVREACETHKAETAEKETKGEDESTGKGLGAEEVQEMKTREKEKETGEPEQAETEDKVSLGVSGTEPKEEADASESAKGVQEGGGDSDAPEKSTSLSSKEGRTGSTSDEPLSPEPEEEEEFWPEFAPSSPESPQSPTASKSLETGSTISGPAASEATTGDTASTEADSKGDENQQPAPEAAPEAKEKKKRPAFDRREITRPRVPPRAQSRKAIMEKFGGAATGPAPNIKKTGGANTVKTMLLEWCRAKTRGYEHVDVQNFSSSWSSGMAFCALIHKFFPDAFDYSALDPANRRENFTLAFSTAENLADCPQLLEVDDMVRMKVPDNKCIYTYIQELYRSLVEKGLVKTKKK